MKIHFAFHFIQHLSNCQIVRSCHQLGGDVSDPIVRISGHACSKLLSTRKGKPSGHHSLRRCSKAVLIQNRAGRLHLSVNECIITVWKAQVSQSTCLCLCIHRWKELFIICLSRHRISYYSSAYKSAKSYDRMCTSLHVGVHYEIARYVDVWASTETW